VVLPNNTKWAEEAYCKAQIVEWKARHGGAPTALDPKASYAYLRRIDGMYPKMGHTYKMKMPRRTCRQVRAEAEVALLQAKYDSVPCGRLHEES
jgi:hypothetical protein